MASTYRTLEHAPEDFVNATISMIVNEQFMTLRGIQGDERTLAFADLTCTAQRVHSIRGGPKSLALPH